MVTGRIPESGNYRLYRCRSCQRRYVAKWLGKPIASVLHEPKNTYMSDWQWIEVIEETEDKETCDVETQDFVNGEKAMRIRLER